MMINVLKVREDLNALTPTRHTQSQTGLSSANRTGIERVAGLYETGSHGVLLASAGRGFTLDAARDLNLASLATSEYQSLDLKKKDLAWQSVKGSGTQDETTRYTRLNAGQIQISAGNRITADMSVKDSAQILANEPGMDWLKQIQADPRLSTQIDWNPIEEAHRKWDYDQQGLTPAAAVVVAIVVTWLTAGVAAEAGAAVVNGAAGAGAATAGGGAVAATMVQVGITTLASQASVSLINNQGDIGATLHELGSQENLRQLAIAMVTAGALKGIRFSKVEAHRYFCHLLSLTGL